MVQEWNHTPSHTFLSWNHTDGAQGDSSLQACWPLGTTQLSLLDSPLCPLYALTPAPLHGHVRSTPAPYESLFTRHPECSQKVLKCRQGDPSTIWFPSWGLKASPRLQHFTSSLLLLPQTSLSLSHLSFLLPPGAQKPCVSRDLLRAPWYISPPSTTPTEEASACWECLFSGAGDSEQDQNLTTTS